MYTFIEILYCYEIIKGCITGAFLLELSIYAVTFMTEILLIVTLNNQFTSPHIYVITQWRSSAPKSGGGGAQTFFQKSAKQKKKKKKKVTSAFKRMIRYCE